MKRNIQRLLLISSLVTLVVFFSCSKGGSGGGGGTPNPCTGVTITVTGTLTQPTTGSPNGAIQAAATGGSSAFTYSLNGGAFQSSGNFTALAAGTYTITAKNAEGCSGSASFTLVATNPCTGITITVNGTTVNPTAAGSSNGSISATATGSTGFTFSLNGAAFQASGNFTGLAAGSYTVTARDANGCTGSANFNLSAPNPCTGVTITVAGTTVNPTGAASNNGSISANATGGTAPYTFNINGGTFQANGNFGSLGAGNYTIVARDANGCTGSSVFTLTVPNPCSGVTITVNSNVTANRPCEAPNGSIVVTGTGGTAPYTYSLNGGTFQASGTFSNLSAGSYTLAARDANGCNGSSTAQVLNAQPGPLFQAVRALLDANCVSCHNTSVSEGGMNWTVDCNVINFKDRIQARAVSGNPSAMPPTGLLPSTERAKITNWINAGGRFTD